MIDADSAFVLYVDHQGHPAPLGLSYHATASRRLASSIDRHPPSTVTEVDSAYCPQCLAFHDASSAANMGYCPKATCRLCPICNSVASLAVESSECFYKCGIDSCGWTSRDCSLVASITVGSDGVVAKEELEKAAETLGSQYKSRTDQSNQTAETHYKKMLKTLEGMAKEQVKGQKSTLLFSSTSAATRRGLDGPEGWSVEALEEALVTKKNMYSTSAEQPLGGKEFDDVSLEEEVKALQDSLQGKPLQSLFLQRTATQPASANDLLPLPIPLRPRKSRRCRAELAEGRPGILLKPKLNPLEGDSSLRTGHGQWWKKDSSAIQVLPRVRTTIHASDGTRHAFLLKVSNPTLGTIRLRLSSSTYTGEPMWDDDEERNPNLENLLVDPLNQLSVNAKLLSNIGDTIQATDVCELEPSEDSFLELGRSSSEEPDQVAKWNAESVLASSKVSKSSPSSLKLVGKRQSNAWFELILAETSLDKGINSAVPIALQIEVGNGSWDSSLIRPEKKGDATTKDLVNFDLVIVWEQLE